MNNAHIGWRVVTWNSATDREFLTRPEALDYITMNDTDGDWHIEPIMPAAPQPALVTQSRRELIESLTKEDFEALPDGVLLDLGCKACTVSRQATQPSPAVPTGWKPVPVEPTVGMCIAGDSARHNVDDMTRTPAIYRAMLAAAPQPAPKVESDECPYLIWYDDQDRKAEIFAGFGARTAALKRFAQVSANWNAHLFVRVQKNTKDDDSPCAEMNAAPQPAKAAPVAWYINSGHGRHVSFDLADNLKALRIGDRNVWTPLYAAPQPVPAYPLPDALYPGSKDWLASDYAGRVEWLHRMYEGAKKEIERLSASAVSQTGWVMVPVEPTEEMIVAAIAAGKFAVGKRDRARNVHRAMLSATPQPAPAVPTGWIAFGERLPARDQLIALWGPNMFQLYCQFYRDNDNVDAALSRAGFTHWHALPTPPKGE